MVGRREADIEDVQKTIDNHDILDDNDEQTTYNFHNMEVRMQKRFRFE